MLNVGTWRFFLWLHAGDLVQAAYKGVLGRESDPSGFAAYREYLNRSRDLAALLSDIARSDEFWDKTIAWRAPDFVQAAFQGLLGRKPDPEAHAAYDAELSGNHELPGLLNDIICSDEFWSRIIKLHAAALISAVFRGLLDREPDPEARDAYGTAISQDLDISGFLSDVVYSEEFWNRFIIMRGPTLFRTLCRGLLGREPDPGSEADFCTDLSNRRDLAGLLWDFTRSNEFWDKAISSRAPEIIQALHRYLCGTSNNPVKLRACAEVFGDSTELSSALPLVGSSNELAKIREEKHRIPHPASKYNDRCLVFIHIQKTAGTSLQNHLSEYFEPQELYREFSDSLYIHSPGELSRYNVFAGHFNYDSLDFIPRKKLSVFTFVRDPKKRLVSLYHFWRAHEPGHESYDGGIPLANHLLIEEFFESERVVPDFGLWNHMCWALLGERKWRRWKDQLLHETDGERIQEIIEEDVRPAIISRLKEFIFVGFQEDFERSVKALFGILQLPTPERIRTDKSLDGLMDSPNFKKTMERQPITSRLDAALDRFVQLDNIIYGEAKELYPN